jgi:hypothetical protein
VERTTLPGGVRLTVTGRRVPELRMLVADGRRMLLRQGARDVLLARVDDDHYGVHVQGLPGYRSPVPPVPFAEARRLGGDPVRWAHWFADRLTEPLHDGDWVLTERTLPQYVLGGDLVREPVSYLDWFDGWQGAVPLRGLSDVDASRVKAYRKLGPELPPVLLWAQSGLDGYVVLDGHDRLVAALADGTSPRTLVLARAGESTRSVAWPLPGGADEWDRIAGAAGFDPDLT